MRDLEAELLNMACSDVEIEPVLQDIAGEQRLDIHARGVWENQRSAFLGWGPRAPTDIRQSREREEAPIFEEGFGH